MPLNKEQVLEGLKKLRAASKQRKFKQSIDLQVSLKDTDVKKPENKIKEVVVLPNNPGKKFSMAVFVDKELLLEAKEVFDEVIKKDDFDNYKNPRQIRKLVRKHKYFISQGKLMGQVAQVFGKFLGPKGKMPDPKMGGVVPDKKGLLKPLYEKLQRTVLVKVKDQPTINVLVGTEDMTDDKLAENIVYVYNIIVQKLPRGEEQVGSAYIKMTMSRSVAL